MTEDIDKSVAVLKKGGVILYPTDTIWGLGCDATNEEAVKKIFTIKQRQEEKSMLVLLDNENKLGYYVNEVPEIAFNIIEVSDKPITIIYPDAQNIAPSLVAEDGSIGIRIVHDDFCQHLIRKLGRPVVSTSANTAGKPWPKNYSTIEPEIIHAVDYIVQYRQNDKPWGKPSGIIKVGVHGEIKIIRE